MRTLTPTRRDPEGGTLSDVLFLLALVVSPFGLVAVAMSL